MKCAGAGQDASWPIRTGRASAAFAAVAPAPDRGGEDEEEAAFDEHLFAVVRNALYGPKLSFAPYPLIDGEVFTFCPGAEPSGFPEVGHRRS
jgi:hypothetical protein